MLDILPRPHTHNIEDSSRESASVSLTQEKLNETLEDLNKLSE